MIFFDWFHTLSNNTFWDHLNNDINRDLYNRITAKVFKNENISIKEWMRGNIKTEDVLKVVAENEADFLFLLKELEYSCKNTKFAYVGIETILNKLKNNKIKLGIATDNMDVFMKYTVPNLNLNKYFDYIICSSDIGYLKLDTVNEKPIFFEKTLKENNLTYKDCLFIDDQEKFIDFYKNIGMNAECIKNTNEIVNIISKYIEL